MRENEVNNIEVLTIGHSTLSYERFLELVRRAKVTAVADVRSSPYSRQCPQFNRETLSDELRADGIAYVFLGKELGGRPSGDHFYSNGVADYERMSQAPEFSKGLDRVLEGARKYRVALLCSERDPIDCHRCLLVARALADRGVHVSHILGEGEPTKHAEIEHKLLKISGRNADDFFTPRAEQLATAYREHSRKVAFAKRQSGLPSSTAAE
jgi:uncharacterized protein (DUF488 family)